jgi:hypothetical protein
MKDSAVSLEEASEWLQDLGSPEVKKVKKN